MKKYWRYNTPKGAFYIVPAKQEPWLTLRFKERELQNYLSPEEAAEQAANPESDWSDVAAPSPPAELAKWASFSIR